MPMTRRSRDFDRSRTRRRLGARCQPVWGLRGGDGNGAAGQGDSCKRNAGPLADITPKAADIASAWDASAAATDHQPLDHVLQPKERPAIGAADQPTMVA